MIIKMKKVSLVVQDSSKEKALRALENAKILHTGVLDANSAKVNQISSKLSLLTQAMTILPKIKATALSVENKDELIEKIIALGNKIKSCDADVLSYSKEIDRVSAWGDFSPSSFADIKEHGYFVNVYEATSSQYSSIDAKVDICKLQESKGKVKFATISKSDVDLEGISSLELPSHSITEFKSMIETRKSQLVSYQKELNSLAGYLKSLQEYEEYLKSELEFEKTLAAMDNHDGLAVLSGYAPVDSLDKLKFLVTKEGWAAIYADPTEEDTSDVPTLTKQKGAGKLIDPLLKMFDLVPGYKEFDVSLVMFFFFSMFFSMIIADAGYGLIFLLIGGFFAIKQISSGKKIPSILLLFIWLSVCSITWGAVTGNWFGLEYIQEQPFLIGLVVSKLKDPLFLQKLTFMIGVAHLSIARLWAFTRHLKTNPLKSLADLGNLAMLVSLYYVVLFLLLGKVPLTATELPGGRLPNWVFPTILVGFVVVLLFHEQKPGRNPIKGMLLGLSSIFPTFLESVENFSNIISYIRLYAVSLAGLAIADAFNGMALSMPLIAGAVVMLAAHSLNIVLAMLGVVVHGLRLNSLEFSNHLGLTWSGSAYNPFGSKKL